MKLLSWQIIKNDDKNGKDKDSEITQPMPPKMSITIQSSDPMEVTITKTCLVVLNHLAKVNNSKHFSVLQIKIKKCIKMC